MWREIRRPILAIALAAAAIFPGLSARADELSLANDKPIYKLGFTALAAGTLPPLFTWWNGTNLKDIVASGALKPLDAEWDAAVKSGEYGRDTAGLFTVDGHVWGMSLGTGRWVIFYNKKLFAKAGLTAPPTTWAEFLDDSAKLKAAGITPVNSTIQNGWRAFTWFSELMLRTNPDAFRGLATGKVAYNGPEAHEAFRIWGDLYAKGYMTDPRSNQDVVDFASGKGAMYLMGDWVVGAVENAGLGGDDLGVFVMPRINTSVEDCIIVDASPILVAKATGDRPDVKKMIAYLMSTDMANVLRDVQGLYIGDLKSKPRSPLISQISDIIATRKLTVVTRWQEATAPEMQGDLIAEFGKFTLDPSPANAEKVMNNMQAINKAYWDNH
jgi:multiple sugar transport system substrate-binding protein